MTEIIFTTLSYLREQLAHEIPRDTFDVLILAINVIIALFVLQAITMIIHLLLNKQLAWMSKPYSGTDPLARKILILGDSTAVGTGAESPEHTIAGRLARDFPDTQVIKRGINGGIIRDLRKQIEPFLNEAFDMIVISVGGNDVWHFSRIEPTRFELAYIFSETSRMSNNRVIFLLYNNIGSAPIFPRIVQFFLNRHGRKIKVLIQGTAAAHRVPIIELFTEDENNPFLENPKVLFARDGIHPSSRGYELWYNRMWREMTKYGFRY